MPRGGDGAGGSGRPRGIEGGSRTPAGTPRARSRRRSLRTPGTTRSGQARGPTRCGPRGSRPRAPQTGAPMPSARVGPGAGSPARRWEGLGGSRAGQEGRRWRVRRADMSGWGMGVAGTHSQRREEGEGASAAVRGLLGQGLDRHGLGEGGRGRTRLFRRGGRRRGRRGEKTRRRMPLAGEEAGPCGVAEHAGEQPEEFSGVALRQSQGQQGRVCVGVCVWW